MSLFPLLAQFDVVKPDASDVIAFVLLTLAFLGLCGGVLRWERSQPSKLMLLGILVAVVSVGYGTMVAVPSSAVLTSGLMKIAVILVLGAVACIVVSFLREFSRTAPSDSKEPINER
jgi:cytochrome c biogenesis factor